MTHAAKGPDTLASDLLQAMFLTMRRIRREGTQGATLSYPDLMILGYLRRSPGRGVSDLAAEAGVSGPTMSGQVKRLEAAGLIVRESGPDSDRRRVSLALSPKAEAIVASAKQQGADWISSRLAELPESERQVLAQAVPALMSIAGDPQAPR